MSGGFATLSFARTVAAPPETLWQAWTAPAARAVWAAPTPEVEVAFLEADSRVGGREVSLCHVAGEADIRCDVGWLVLEPGAPLWRSVNSEVIARGGVVLSAALVTAEVRAEGEGARIGVTVQLSSLGGEMEAGYRAGFEAGIGNLAGVAERTMVIRRAIRAPVERVWRRGGIPSAAALVGPEGFSCRPRAIDLRAGGEWVFDMIGPDGTCVSQPSPLWAGPARGADRLCAALGRGRPKHADALGHLHAGAEGTRGDAGHGLATA
ncbi:MAG: SRPBCC domain-containing protein [Paracoccaceae bacterium]